MASPTFLYRLQFGGALFTAEQWSCSLHIDAVTLLGQPASAFTPALKTWMSATTHSSAASLDKVSFNRIDPLTGKFTEPGATNADFPTGAGRTGGGAPIAPQLSLAVSTRTALARGRAHAGRFYPPSGGGVTAVDSVGLVNDGVVSGAATTAQTLLNAINVLVDPNGRLVVFSRIGQQVETITQIRVGHVLDTQRRRRRSLGETYSVPLAIA